jgi:hypothetical protein
MNMGLPFDILDRILSLLVSHPESLTACLDIPALAPIAEKYFFYRIPVRIGSNNSFMPRQFAEYVSTYPRILSYARILEIKAEFNHDVANDQIVTQLLDEFSDSLLMFRALECIILSTTQGGWRWSTTFRAALEDRLKIPTVKEVHLVGSRDFPPSIFDSCKNIENLSLSGVFFSENQFNASPLPQLKSLTLDTFFISSSLLAWITRHISELRSLKFQGPSVWILPQLLEVCSGTLNKLDINNDEKMGKSALLRWSHCYTDISVGMTPRNYPNLQQLTIRTTILLENDEEDTYCNSRLPEALEVIESLYSISQTFDPRH